MKKWISALVAAAMLLTGCGNAEAQELAQKARDAAAQRGTVSFNLKLTHRPINRSYTINAIDSWVTTEGLVEISGALTPDMQVQLTLASYTETTYDYPSSSYGSGGGPRTRRTLNGPALGYYADNVFYYDMGYGMYCANLSASALRNTLANHAVPAASISELRISSDGDTVLSFQIPNGSDLANLLNALFGMLYPEQVGTLTGIRCGFMLDSNGLPWRITAEFTNAFANNAEYSMVLDNFRYGEPANISAPANIDSYRPR